MAFSSTGGAQLSAGPLGRNAKVVRPVDVYEVSLELEPLRGSTHFGEGVGLYVFVYLAAPSLRAALDAAEAWADRSRYTVLDVDHCIRVNLVEYEPHDDDYPTAAELASCLESGAVVAGVFHTYEAREEH